MVEERSFENLRYIIRFPHDYKAGDTRPVILFMHGAGSRGTDLGLIKTNPYFSHIEKHKDFPFITVAPQCSKDTWFDMLETVNAFAKHIIAQDFADSRRFYLMGASMGGYAVWQMAMAEPSLYAAIVPICGGGMYWNSGRLKNLPIWAFHGDCDTTVQLRESEMMVEAVNQNGGNAKLTVYKDCGHDSWSETYRNPQVFQWLLLHQRSERTAATTDFQDSTQYG